MRSLGAKLNVNLADERRKSNQLRHIPSQAAVTPLSRRRTGRTPVRRRDSGSACLRSPNHYITLHPSVAVQQTQDEIKEIKAAVSSCYKQTTNCCLRSLVARQPATLRIQILAGGSKGRSFPRGRLYLTQCFDAHVSSIFDANGKKGKEKKRKRKPCRYILRWTVLMYI